MAADERPRRPCERRYVIVSKETVRQHAESVGIAELSDEILGALAEDVSYRVREVIQVLHRAIDLQLIHQLELWLTLHFCDFLLLFFLSQLNSQLRIDIY